MTDPYMLFFAVGLIFGVLDLYLVIVIVLEFFQSYNRKVY